MTAVLALAWLWWPAPAGAVDPPATEPARVESDGGRNSEFGIEAAPEPGGLRVSNVRPGSQAWELGLRQEDLITHLAGEEAKDSEAASKALAGVKPGTRLWAVVRRGRSVLALEAPLPRLQPAESRGLANLSPQEHERQRAQLEAARSRVPAVLRSRITPRLSIGAGQRTWARFPGGLPRSLKAGDTVPGALITGLASDAQLDFLAVPPRSQVWAEVTEASEKDGIRLLRLHVFKLTLLDGHTYPVSARVRDVAGDHVLTQVSRGGTLVSADPAGIGAEAKLELEFVRPLVLFEAAASYRAGPGLWLKQGDSEAGAGLVVSHVIPGRSAEQAGVKVGDEVVSLDGTSASKLDFAQAIERLYGPAGSKVKLAMKSGGSSGSPLELERGMRFEPGPDGPRAVRVIPPGHQELP